MKNPNKNVLSSKIATNIHNRFDVEVIDAITGKIKNKAVGYNIICDQLWTRLLTPNSYFNNIHYGSGSGVPAASDTSLFSYLGNKSATLNNHAYENENGVFWIRKHIQIIETEHNGTTITEVGIGFSSSTTSLCTHAMLKDMDGNDISITKTDTDIINIYATVYVHFNPNGYDNGTIKLLGPYYYYRSGSLSKTQYGFLGYLAGLGGSVPSLINPSRYHTNRTAEGASGTTVTYSIADKKITVKAPRLAATDYNVGGLTEISFGNSFNYYGTGLSASFIYPCYITLLTRRGDWFPYSKIEEENVGTGDGTTTEFSLDYPYAYDATVYVDGVEDSNIEVYYGSNLTDIGNTVLWIDADSKENAISIARYVNSTNQKPNVFFNPAHENYGLATVYASSGATVSVSNDLEEWIDLGTATTIAVPEEYQHYKYWKSSSTFGSNIGVFNNTNLNVLKFTSPPPEGAVITADYKCDCIAKNANNVFDLTFEIHLGEYIEEV